MNVPVLIFVLCLSVYCRAANVTDCKHHDTQTVSMVVDIANQGLVRGLKANDGDYFEFLGVPYATVTEDVRFMDTISVPKWSGIKEANNSDIECLQFDAKTNASRGAEDCLVLNVYVPRNNPSVKKAVLFYIHGGGYKTGSAKKSYYHPGNFVKEDIILVTANYRLGILGFLCKGPAANAGAKDVINALKWVNLNIEKFGGDTNRITVAGHSAGGVLTDLVVLSKKAKGLFQRAITMSCSLLYDWTLPKNVNETTEKIAQIFDLKDTDIVKALQKIDSGELLEKSIMFEKERKTLLFGPCIEQAWNANAVLDNTPSAILKSKEFNDVPHIFGTDKEDGMLIYENMENISSFLTMLDKDFKLAIPENILTRLKVHTVEIVEKIREFYFGNQKIANNTFAKFLTESNFELQLFLTLNTLAEFKRAPVYVYQFAYDGALAYRKLHNMSPEGPGVGHGDELGYLFFDNKYSEQHPLTPQLQEDLNIAKQMTSLWASFIKSGVPVAVLPSSEVIVWPQYWPEQKSLIISNNTYVQQKHFQRVADFWMDIIN